MLRAKGTKMQLTATAIGVIAGLTTVLGASPRAHAWNDFGHMEVAAIAFERLNTKTKEKVAHLLSLNPRYPNWIVGAKRGDGARMAFMRAATWADAIKSDRAYQTDSQTAPTAGQNIGYADTLKHAYWHYVDQPFSPDGTPLLSPAAPNAATQIPLLRAALAAATTTDDVKSYDLVWLLHLVGDVHQPLHCVSRFDASDAKGDVGGNNVKISGNVQPPSVTTGSTVPTDLLSSCTHFTTPSRGKDTPWLQSRRRLPS